MSQYHGKCFCGKYQYTISESPIRVVHCHCNNCRQSVGAPFVTWIVIHKEKFFITPSPPVHTARNGALRTFCESCGSSLSYSLSDRPNYIDVTAGTLNHPNDLEPDWHIWGKHKVDWVKLHDDLPFYDIFPQ